MQNNVKKNVKVATGEFARIAQKNFNALVSQSRKQNRIHAVVNGVVMSVKEALSYDFA